MTPQTKLLIHSVPVWAKKKLNLSLAGTRGVLLTIEGLAEMVFSAFGK